VSGSVVESCPAPSGSGPSRRKAASTAGEGDPPLSRRPPSASPPPGFSVPSKSARRPVREPHPASHAAAKTIAVLPTERTVRIPCSFKEGVSSHPIQRFYHLGRPFR